MKEKEESHRKSGWVASAWCHSNTNLDILDCLFQSIIPKAIVQPQTHELQRGLGTKRVFSRHVEVIHEVYQLLATDWHIHTLPERATNQCHNNTDFIGF